MSNQQSAICFYVSGHGFGHASRDIELIQALQRAEADALGRVHAGLVVADIPPLAFAAAATAGVPSIAVGNFTWDWIYGVYDSFPRAAPGAIEIVRRAYAHATLALRLPLHGGFEAMSAVVRDIPFIARRSTRPRDETRRLLRLPSDRPIVLPSFGGDAVHLPWDTLSQSTHFALLRDQNSDLERHRLRYQDLVAAADIVVSKPGYGIVSECIANGTSLLYTSRGRFAEQDVFVTQMPRMLRCRSIDRQDLLSGRWDSGVEALLRQPHAAERPRTDGADVAAEAIGKFLDR